MTESERKVMEQALERLESHEYWMDERAIQALRQALAIRKEHMNDLEKAAKGVLEAWEWDVPGPKNKVITERIEALRKALDNNEEEADKK